MRTPPDIEARRAAKRIGLIARRDILGGFMLLDEQDGIVVGARFELTPKEVIDLCRAALNDKEVNFEN